MKIPLLPVLGDSITSGVGAAGQSYPGLLAEKLRVEVINAGVPGDTSEDGLARFDEVLDQDPWMVIVELGGNDILRRGPAHPGRGHRRRGRADRGSAEEAMMERRVYGYILGPKEEAMSTAKVFWSGNSQALRLPKDFRFPPGTEEVEIRREGERIVLEPVHVEEWPESFWRAFEGMPEDFERPTPVRQTRESLDL